LRCQRSSVSGFTCKSASRHWNIRLRVAIIHRVESSARRGLNLPLLEERQLLPQEKVLRS
jgi:hypothetical protein